MADASRTERGALENEVLAALAADGALTPREVLGRLARPLAYTTVLTTLLRLHDKGAVTREPRGRAFAYRLSDRAAVPAREMRRALDRAPDRARVLARFVDELDPADVPVLQRLLRDLDGQP